MTDTPTAEPSMEPDADQRSVASDDARDARDGQSDGPPDASGSAADTTTALERGDVRRLLAWGALAICSLLAIVAVIRFYGSVTDAIDLWIASRHRPIAHAAFNLVVLLLSLIGISALVRELST